MRCAKDVLVLLDEGMKETRVSKHAVNHAFVIPGRDPRVSSGVVVRTDGRIDNVRNMEPNLGPRDLSGQNMTRKVLNNKAGYDHHENTRDLLRGTLTLSLGDTKLQAM